MTGVEREELYGRLEQVRRHFGSANDAVTKDRMTTLVVDLEEQVAAVEADDADAPPTMV